MGYVHALLLSLLALPLAAWAQGVPPSALSEAGAVRLALARAELSDLEQGAWQAAEADVQAAERLPNPTLSYSRDQVGGGNVEQTLMLSQDFDLAGRRGLRRDAAQRRAQAVSWENERRRLELAGEVRRAYVDVLFSTHVIRATEVWVEQFQRVEAQVDRLARAGEASGFDRRRLARERQGAQVHLAGERASLLRAQARLAFLIGSQDSPEVAGGLAPASLPPLATALASLDQRPDLLALARLAEAADLEGRAAGSGGIPDLTLGIGPRWLDSGGGREHGVSLAVSMPLPLFDRQQAAQRRALAEATRLKAEQRLLRLRVAAEIGGLYRQVEALRQAAADYRAGAVAATPELIKVAEAAYRGGESSLLELLDAYRGALETEMTALELEKRARLARIEYDLMTGSPL